MALQPLWRPSENTLASCNLKQYQKWLSKHHHLNFDNYLSLWQWSVDDYQRFWITLREYFNLQLEGQILSVIDKQPMPYTQWFNGISLSYAEHVFRNATNEHPAIIFKSERSSIQTVSWDVLTKQVASLQDILKQYGVGDTDTVIGYLPCIAEATAAFLAVNSLGAIWSSCSPDFGTNAVIDRFAQINPKVLFAVDTYQYNGKRFDKTETVKALVEAIPSLELVILITDNPVVNNLGTETIYWNDATANTNASLTFKRVPFDHPIFVLYSSGTTGLPKAITHRTGGILLEQLKYCTFHNDFKKGERCFWYTTTGWMMWNYIHGSLLTGSTMVLYDGSPAYPSLDVLWKFTEEAKINHFGTSAGFIMACHKEDRKPGEHFNLSALRSIGSTGSTLPPEGFEYIYKHVKTDVWLASMSGGTDVCSAFVGGNPMLPVYSGEIQCRALGCKVEAYNEAALPVMEEEGELVITAPMPSMPVYFWNDPEYKRYKESYFDVYDGVWRHGDWIKITSRGTVIIYGRSDATLNRGGVRIGTSEIYRAVDEIPEVKDALIVCIEEANGDFWMPLFVLMKETHVLTEELKKKINATLRQQYSPRHVPDEILAVPDIPYTISGKKTETPVKKILSGKDPQQVVNAGSLRNPESLQFFVNLFAMRKQNQR